MKNKNRFNLPYFLAFIFLVLSVPIFLISVLIAYGLEDINASIICSAVGVFLVVVGIILASLSKEKTEESEVITDDFEDKEENKFEETIDKV